MLDRAPYRQLCYEGNHVEYSEYRGIQKFLENEYLMNNRIQLPSGNFNFSLTVKIQLMGSLSASRIDST